MNKFFQTIVIAITLHPLNGQAQRISETINQNKTPLWKYSTPEEQGIDSEVLLRMFQKIQKENIRFHSILIVKNNKIVLESYRHPYSWNIPHNIKSVNKSVLSALVGIAMEEGIIENPDIPVSLYFPEIFTKENDTLKNQITLRNLLTMTSGLDLDRDGPIESKISQSNNWIAATLTRKMSDKPGKRYNYSTFNTHLLSAILSKSMDQDLLDFACKKLFHPIGIQDVQWAKDPQGYYFGGGDMWMTPLDMVTFGSLFSNYGNWKGQQIISKQWVEESTKNQLPHFGIEDAKAGYCWWMGKLNDWYVANGINGQTIAINPEQNMVYVTTFAEQSAHFRLFGQYIIPSIKPEKSLPENQQALDSLNTIIHSLQFPSPNSVMNMPEMAYNISGKKYIMDNNDRDNNDRDNNDRDIKSMTFHFSKNDTSSVFIETSQGEWSMQLGLDGLYQVSETNEYGSMPTNNKMALRGEWTGDQTFILDYHELGAPFEISLEMKFENDQVFVTQTYYPFEWKSEVKGQC